MNETCGGAPGQGAAAGDADRAGGQGGRGRNRLASAGSPYLRQHADNPVDWYPWGPEALDRARKEDRPIFLSIGYAACHWCHVMERESFEDEATARFLNENFVSIKVDREERPDLDDIYMAAVQMIAGQGGWPMSVFLTPDLVPFFGGTYFPPEDRYGRPGFPRLLQGLLQAYRTRRTEIESGARQVLEALQTMTVTPPTEGGPTRRAWQRAVDELAASFDAEFGGFGSAPKFPHSFAVQILLREHDRGAGPRPLQMAERTLEAMALGGLYDQLGGGFHRYATDDRWLVPHFEKMLYDQALLVVAYSEAHQVTGRALYARVVRETCDYVLRDLGDPAGGFYSSEDADSEGEEGRFYVWTASELGALLGESFALFAEAYGVEEGGNWEGHSILERVVSTEELAARREVDSAEIEAVLEAARSRLLAQRATRIRPGRDEKILTAWNGLMIRALARAGRVLSEPRFVAAAVGAAEFLLERMTPGGRLHRVCMDGIVHGPGYLEDHVDLAAGLVELYEATFESRWLDAALVTMDRAVELFADPAGGFFLTAEDHAGLIVRLKMAQDGSVPAGNSMAAEVLLRLGRLTGRADLERRGEETIASFGAYLERMPAGLHQMLLALDLVLGPRREIVLAGPQGPELQVLRRVVDSAFLPRIVLAYTPDGVAALPLLAGKEPANGRPLVYVCRDFVCRSPIADPAELSRVLRLGEEAIGPAPDDPPTFPKGGYRA